jgi:DNA-binding winged helix-turn-helix (wHTH) protein
MRLAFDDFCLDLSSRQLLRDGKERHLEPKAFDLLALLLSRRPEAVSKGDIQEHLWPGTFVSESSLTGLVTQIRQALEDEPRKARFLRTVHGFGYAFCGTAVEEGAMAAVASVPSRAGSRVRKLSAQVLWDEVAFVLSEGENILGRDEAAGVCLDWPGVSRQHARIVVAPDGATLEDLGSKNGTYLREQKVASPTPLADGDIFRLGRLALEFRLVRGALSTRTEVIE